MSGTISTVGRLVPPEIPDDEPPCPGGTEPTAAAPAPGGPPARAAEAPGRERVLASLARQSAEALSAEAPSASGPDVSALGALLPHQGLPEVLLEAPGAVVIHGTDPGDFYCEHMFYVSQLEAAREGSPVLANAYGERLVGFLHVPADDHTYAAGGDYDQAERHAGTRAAVGAALRGYFEDAVAGGADSPARILLTGYDTFQSVLDNPTADFVTHPENLDAALASAFGLRLLTPEGEVLPGATADACIVRYRVIDACGEERDLEVALRRFPVSDAALDPADPRSIQQAVEGFQPHAILSMGVTSAGDYKAEHHADRGGLGEVDGRFVHDDAREPDQGLPDNYSLARAIVRGGSPGIA